MEDREKLFRKFRALIERANHPNTPEHEARLARERAEYMMIRHSITEAMAFEGHSDRERPIVMDGIEIFGPYSIDRMSLLNVIANVFGCKLVRMRDHNGKLSNRSNLYGFDADIDIAWTLFDSLDAQLVGELARFQGGTRRLKISFILGFSSTVKNRLQKMYREVVSESSSGTEMVLRERKQDVDNLLHKEIGDIIVNKRRTQVDIDSHSKGSQAGERADIFLPGARFDGAESQAPALHH